MFKSFFKEFEKFAMRGNVIDMAVGIVIGAAFGKIVNSLVSDIIMPPLGLLLGQVDFTNLFITLKNGPKISGPYDSLIAAQTAGATTLNLGLFINTIISFIIMAFAIFLMLKFINKLNSKSEPAEPTTKVCTYCFKDIPIPAIKCPFCTADLDKKKAK